MKTFCTYLTIYSGDKLPLFYLGSSTVERIMEKGYYGSVLSKKYRKIWEKELIENRHLFDIVILTEGHPTRKDATAQERKFQKQKDVVRNTQFINMSIAQVEGAYGYSAIDIQLAEGRHPAKGLKWLTNGIDHRKASGEKLKQLLTEGWTLGRTVSIETRAKTSKALKGRPSTRIGNKNSKYQTRPKSTCVHCGFIGDISNVEKWHNDNCRVVNPDRPLPKRQKSPACPHCGKRGSGINHRSHFDKCKQRISI